MQESLQDRVAKLADELLAQGMRPTVRRIREALGGGSPNLIAPALKAWRSQHPVAIAPAEDARTVAMLHDYARRYLSQLTLELQRSNLALANDVDTLTTQAAFNGRHIERLEADLQKAYLQIAFLEGTVKEQATRLASQELLLQRRINRSSKPGIKPAASIQKTRRSKPHRR